MYLFFAVLLVPMSALTDPAVQVPGHSCRYYDPLGDDDYFDPGGGSANAIKNTSGSSRYVTCPIHKESAQDLTAAWIYISSSNATCRLYKRSTDGTGASYWSISDDPTEIDNGRWIYSWGDNGWLEGSYKSMSIYCNIPSNAWIESYMFTTQD